MDFDYLYLVIGLGYLAFAIYVILSKKTAQKKRAESVTLNTEEENNVPIKTIPVTYEISKRIKTIDVQQFYANILTALTILKRYLSLSQKLPALRHAFPYAIAADSKKKILNEDMLQAEMDRVSKEIGMSREELQKQVNISLQTFVHTQNVIIARRLLRGHAKVREEIDKIIRQYRDILPLFVPMTLKDMEQLIIQRARVEVVQERDLTLLSACITHEDEKVPKFFIKKGIHPILRTFLLGHEFGHWWLHLDHGKMLKREGVYLHSAHEWGPEEEEADKISLALMFPTPYLAWLEIEHKLKPEYIIQDLQEKYPNDEISDRLYEQFISYLETRINNYWNYKKYLEHSVLEIKIKGDTIAEKDMVGLIPFLEHQGYAWARLDGEYCLKNCGKKWAGFFGLKVDALADQKLHIVDDFTPLELQKKVQRQLEHKKKNLEPTLYFTQYSFSGSQKEEKVVDILLKTFPIVNSNGTYSGSLGVAAKHPLDLNKRA